MFVTLHSPKMGVYYLVYPSKIYAFRPIGIMVRLSVGVPECKEAIGETK